MKNKCVFSIMEKLLLLALSVSGLSLASTDISTDIVRRYHYVDREYSWLEAQAHCREKFVDLATVTDQGDDDRLLKALQGRQGYTWIGLQDDLTKWVWTNMSFHSKNYSNWESEEIDNSESRDKCILMKPSGSWVDETCAEERFSVCYDEKGPDRYIVVNKSMQWKNARTFCLDHHTHLVSVMNSSENQHIASLLPADAWIGLSRWSWKRWSDKSRVTFTHWGKEQPDNKEDVVESCVAADVDAAWWDDECNLRRPFVCYSIQRTQSMRVKLKFRSEADLMDPAVSQQLLEQIRARLAKRISEFDIKWMEKDGSIFHKEKDETGEVVDLSKCAG